MNYPEFEVKMASKTSLRKRCLPDRNIVPVIPAWCLSVTYPQAPEIITYGDGCAFCWNAEKVKANILTK